MSIILLTILITGNIVGVICASITTYYQTKHELYRLNEYEKNSIETSSDKGSVSIDEGLSAVDVAKYIIRYLHSKELYVNIITLGSLLYFVQAQYAVGGRSCFKEKIIAGCLSAEVQEVRDYFCGFGFMEIMPIGEKARTPITLDERMVLVDWAIDKCIECDLNNLSELIRCQKPWREARKTAEHVITVESLRDYFFK